MATVGTLAYLGTSSLQTFLGTDEVFFNTFTAPQLGFRNDPYSASLVFGTPGSLFSTLGMTYAWSDVSADIRGTGTNLTVLTTNVTSSATYNTPTGFSDNGYVEASKVSTTGRFYSSDNTDFEFGSGNFTIEYWIASPTTTPTGGTFSDYTVYNVPQTQMAIFLNSSGVSVYVGAGSTEYAVFVNQGGGYTIGEWYHYAIVRSGSTWYLFRNGTQIATTTLNVTLNATNASKYIGSYNGNSSTDRYFQDFRIYKGAAKYTSNFTPESMVVNG